VQGKWRATKTGGAPLTTFEFNVPTQPRPRKPLDTGVVILLKRYFLRISAFLCAFAVMNRQKQ